VRGLSGAVVIDNNDGTVTKSGGLSDRTREQGEWIVKHGGSAFPKVVNILSDGYVMEKLEFVEYYDVNPSISVPMLKKHVWTQQAVVPPTAQTKELLEAKMLHTINKYLADHVDESMKREILISAKIAGDGAYRMQHCLTHGDPTAENVMKNATGDFVFIDPIPATEVVPDSPAVDIGKMLQSAYGWEDAKYQTGVIAYRRSDLKEQIEDDRLFAVGEAWGVVHVMRAVPYVLRNIPDSLPRVLTVLKRAIERW
jgi:hypothetical protein